MKSEVKSGGTLALVAGGIASAFSLAACCALPILLAGAGFSTYWLAPVATLGLQYSTALTFFAVISLAGSAFIVFRTAKTCAPGELCARPWFRTSITAAVIVGTVLLISSKLYA